MPFFILFYIFNIIKNNNNDNNRKQHKKPVQALEQSNGVQAKAAELLKTTRRILKYKMDKLGITQEDKCEEVVGHRL